MNWDMPAASSVRFLAVRGTIWVGDCQTTYNFTLVEYHLHIDEVPWIIFSTLADALEKEFDPAFWDTVNYGRKERWGFLEPPWDGKVYGAAPQYAQVRLSIFNRDAHTMRVVQPFVWNHTHLKVHPNGAMIFNDQKRLAFLLPLIVEAHELLPPKPLFWVNEDNTIPLWRTTLWTHDETIQWLAETGEPYPQELRDELQPRIDQLKSSQHAKRALPPPPPLPTRWTERSAAKQPVQKMQADAPQDPKCTQSTPQQVADRERQHMELQSIIHQANQQTLADSRPAATRQTQKPANLLAASQQSTDNAATAASSNPSTGVVAEAPTPQQSKPPDKISAQSLFHRRPGPPSALPANKAQTDTPGTGVLSSDSHSATHSKDDEQQQPPEQLAAHDDTSTEEDRRLQIHPKHRQRLKRLTLLVLAALSPPVTPCRTSTSPQRTSQRCRTWKRQPVKEWPPMKRDSSMPASTLLALESALKECKMPTHQALRNPLLLQIWKWKSLTDRTDS